MSVLSVFGRAADIGCQPPALHIGRSPRLPLTASTKETFSGPVSLPSYGPAVAWTVFVGRGRQPLLDRLTQLGRLVQDLLKQVVGRIDFELVPQVLLGTEQNEQVGQLPKKNAADR